MWDDGWDNGWHHGDDDDFLHLSYPEQLPEDSQQQGLEEAAVAEQQHSPSLDAKHGGSGAAKKDEGEGGGGAGSLRVWRYDRKPPAQASHPCSCDWQKIGHAKQHSCCTQSVSPLLHS
jgi:hypothetical protein